MSLFIAIVSLGIWIYLFFAHGSFWRIRRFMLTAGDDNYTQTTENEPFIVAVVPARDEADVIAPAISSLLRQSGVRIHVILIDDGSSDDTATAANRAASGIGQIEQLTVVKGLPLPAGWSGKLWAVHQGMERARSLNPDFLLLTDADIVHAPNNLGKLARLARARKYDLASLMVKLHCRSLAERALIPAFVFFFLLLYPPAWISNPRRRTAGAAGGCILIRPEALAKAGGIEAIRQEIIDDCALALRVKRSGGRVWLGLTEETESIRPYSTFAAMERMISRAAFNQLRHSTLLLVFALLALAITYVAPPALALTRHGTPAVFGASAWLLMAVCFLPIVRFYHLNLLWALALPLIAVFYMGAAIHSAFKFWTGKGGEWKGRIQDPPQRPNRDSEAAEMRVESS
jgi:hopene-associated glycosyltransferase HpnB